MIRGHGVVVVNRIASRRRPCMDLVAEQINFLEIGYRRQEQVSIVQEPHVRDRRNVPVPNDLTAAIDDDGIAIRRAVQFHPEQRVARLHSVRFAVQDMDVRKIRWQRARDELQWIGGSEQVPVPILDRDCYGVGTGGLEPKQRHGMRGGIVIKVVFPDVRPFADGYIDPRVHIRR